MQTTSLALSKRLKAFGVPQTSTFWYHYMPDVKDYMPELYFPQGLHGDKDIATFLSCEIGELLPDYAVTMRTKDGWTAQIVGSDNMAFGWIDTEAEARGLLLEYLIQQGIITF